MRYILAVMMVAMMAGCHINYSPKKPGLFTEIPRKPRPWTIIMDGKPVEVQEYHYVPDAGGFYDYSSYEHPKPTTWYY